MFMENKLNALDVARWFVIKNPGLKEDTNKLNVLMFISNAMHYVIFDDTLFAEPFKDTKGYSKIPFVDLDFELLLDANNGNIDKLSDEQRQVLGTVFYMYNNRPLNRVISDIYYYKFWDNKQNYVDFKEINEDFRGWLTSLYNSYEGVDFDDIRRIEMNGNIFYYNKSNIPEIDEDLYAELEKLPKMDPVFIAIDDDGELEIS